MAHQNHQNGTRINGRKKDGKHQFRIRSLEDVIIKMLYINIFGMYRRLVQKTKMARLIKNILDLI
jgi:hypothetical protein